MTNLMKELRVNMTADDFNIISTRFGNDDDLIDLAELFKFFKVFIPLIPLTL